jgi:hypothetical protein
MSADYRARDVRIFSKPNHFGKDGKIAVGIVAELRKIYSRKALLIMSRFSRGCTLVQDGKVITAETLEDRIRGWGGDKFLRRSLFRENRRTI